MGRHWNDFFAATILVNNGYMTKFPACFANPFGIIGGMMDFRETLV
jgi:hypothetical protein